MEIEGGGGGERGGRRRRRRRRRERGLGYVRERVKKTIGWVEDGVRFEDVGVVEVLESKATAQEQDKCL